jgi:hypothetical protein
MKLHATLLAACIAAALAVPARAQTPAPADSAIRAASPAEHEQVERARQAAAARVRRDPNLITAAEIEGTTASDAMILVQRHRPQWLRARPTGSVLDAVIVYVNGGRVGSARELRNMKAESIGEMRFIRSEEAVARYGMGHSAGVILVTVR